jgi:hypothetical protein
MSLSLSGSLGAIIGIFAQMYIPEGVSSEQIAWLLTFPPLFIGVGMTSCFHVKRANAGQVTFSSYQWHLSLDDDLPSSSQVLDFY